MSEFNKTSGQDPFLHISLKKGEIIYAESNAMVLMDSTLDLEASLHGGIFSSVIRNIANNQSFFRQKVTANRGDGDIILSPVFSGNIEIINIDQRNEFYLNDGVHLASESSVNMTYKTQGIAKGLFGGTGGFIITKASGYGKIAVGCYGDIFEIEITPEMPRIIDNNHVVAWSVGLDYELSASTSKKKGFISNILNSQLTGESMITKFSGSGKVYICSRNKIDFAAWLLSLSKSNK